MNEFFINILKVLINELIICLFDSIVNRTEQIVEYLIVLYKTWKELQYLIC
jgi:hypothetical protein